MLPVVRAINLMRPHRVDIDYVHRSGHFVNKDERADSSEHLLELAGQNHQIILADRRQLQDVRVLVLRVATLLVV